MRRRTSLLFGLLLLAALGCAGGGGTAPVGPGDESLTRLLAEEYATTVGALDAPEIAVWETDADIREHLRAERTRAFARALRVAGAFDGDSLRFRGGPLFDRSPEILAALAAKTGMDALVVLLARDFGYRLRTTHGADLARLLGDEEMRRELGRRDVVAGWKQVARAGRFALHPRLPREVVTVALEPDLPAILNRLRHEAGIGLGTDGLPALAALTRAGRARDLLAPDHLVLLKRLDEFPGPPPRLSDLPGTLEFSSVKGALEMLGALVRLGWRPRFTDPDETAALMSLTREVKSYAFFIHNQRPDHYVGRDAPLLSVRTLLEGYVFEPWLDAGDRAFAKRLPDTDASRAKLEAAILATRGDRPVAIRPRTGYDESGRALPYFSRPDLCRIVAIQRSLADPDVVRRLVGEALADRDDRSGEHGGILVLDDGALSWRAEKPMPGHGMAGDGAHRLPFRPDPAQVPATYHFHALGGARVAGPSPGRVVGDLASARLLGVDGVVLTLLPGDRLDVDFHDTRGHVFDVGVYP